MISAERDLVLRVQSGDEPALAEFFDRYFDALYRFVYHRVGRNHHDAEDLAQEVFLAAVKDIGTYAGTSNLFGWLAGIARRRLSRFYRRKKRGRLEMALEEADAHLQDSIEKIASADLPDDVCESKEVQELVDAVLSGLPPRYGRILRMKYADGLSVDDIARREQASFKAIESALTRARECFKSAIQLVVKGLNGPQLEG